MKDALLYQTKAFPAAASNNSSTAFDLGANAGPNGIQSGLVDLKVSWPALANLVDAKTITFTIQDSADNSSFSSLSMSWVLTGAGGVGVAAGSKVFRLPPTTRQYLNVNAAVLTAGGDNTASSYTVELTMHPGG